jgi:hypothetical protein
VLVAAGVGVAACSSSSSTATTTTAAPTTTVVRSTTTTTASGSTTTTSGHSPVSCRAADLTGSATGGSGAAGTIETSVTLRNVTTATCVLGGYPGLLLIGSDGTALPTTVVRKGTYPFTSQAVTLVTLAPGQSAHVNIGYSDVPHGTETTCPSATAVQVIPPAATDHLTVAMELAPCDGGTLVTSPVLPGVGGQ